MSRVINREHLLTTDAKNVFRKQLWQAAAFSGVDVLTYCIMDNHFHILVHVPDSESTQVPDEEIVRRFAALYGDSKRCGWTTSVACAQPAEHTTPKKPPADQAQVKTGTQAPSSTEPSPGFPHRPAFPAGSTGYKAITARYQSDLAFFSPEAIAAILKNGGSEADSLRRRLLARMHDVSEFMKTLKLRFTIWYNRTHDRLGPLWTERFKSVLVEGSPHAARTVAAYIDLNPIRAGLVEDPKDYAWCGYSQASHGKPEALRGILVMNDLVATLAKPHSTENRDKQQEQNAFSQYRLLLLGKGAIHPPGKEPRHAPSTHASEAPEPGSTNSWKNLLRRRQQGISQARVVGSPEFVQSFLQKRFAQGELGKQRKPRLIRPHEPPPPDSASPDQIPLPPHQSPPAPGSPDSVLATDKGARI